MIRPVIFVSFEQGKIEERPNDFRGCFSILKHYPLLYAAHREKHKIIRSFYGHPHTERPEKVYNGTQREGPDVFHGDFREANSFREKRLLKRIMHESRRHAALRTEAEARAAFDMLQHPEQYEIIHTKVAGSDDAFPQDWTFLGYDVSYEVGFDGAYSILCDCLFLPQWHGCDAEGTLFSEDFRKLNENGLFSNWDDAYAYLVKYRNEAWSEIGWFFICEVRRKESAGSGGKE